MTNLNIKFSFSFFIALMFTISCVHPEQKPESLEIKIEKARIEYSVPGVSIAIISEGKIDPPILLGLANLSKKIPVGPDTLFQACSMTKTLTSALVLMEFDRRKISLDTPVNQFLKRWKIPKHKFGKQVTTRMLLNHTAAISNPYPNGPGKPEKRKNTLVEHFLGKTPASPPLKVEARPGETYKYCNGCYSILQMLIEDITGKDYRDLVKEFLLDPIGMNHSKFDDTLLDKEHENVALNYDDDHKVHPPQAILPIYATGSLWSTAEDMAKLITEVQKGLAGNSSIISKKTAQDLVAPSSTPTRGLGFFIGDRFADEKPGGTYFLHGGQNIGYLAMMVGSLDGKSGAVVMINISSPWTSKDFPHFEFVKKAIRLIANDPSYKWR